MIGWLDCGAGASGDMFLGALVDAGVPLEHLQAVLDSLPVEHITLRAETTSRHAIRATQIHVEAAESHHHRQWRDVREIIGGADLPAAVRDTALDTFARLAHAEAGVHGTAPEDVHFHEVGALDAIADITGACAGVDWLRTHRGLTDLTAGTVSLGGGRVRGAHGAIPVPGPAVLAICEAAGVPVTGGGLPYEACTPTGAALLAAHVSGWGSLPPMRVRRTAVGAGGRDPDETANVLRLVLGEPLPAGTGAGGTGSGAPDAGAAHVLECNVDDFDPRLWPGVLAKLLAAGAADAWLSPILMKKGRPAHTLHVLCHPHQVEVLRAVVFTETSSIGLRSYPVTKHPLRRSSEVLVLDDQQVRVKLAWQADTVVNVSVEYDDVVAAADRLGVPAKVLLARAAAEAERRYRH